MTFNLSVRLVAPPEPTSFLDEISQSFTNILGNESRHLYFVGKFGEIKAFSKRVENFKLAANKTELRELIKNSNYVPISLRDVNLERNEENFTSQEVVFIERNELENLGLNQVHIGQVTKSLTKNESIDLTLSKVRIQLDKMMRITHVWDFKRDSLKAKWSEPIEKETRVNTRELVKRQKIRLNDLQLKSLEPLRTSGSTTLQDNPQKLKNWRAAEGFIREKAINGQDISLNDLLQINRLLEGDSEGSGKLRKTHEFVGGVGGNTYVSYEDVPSMTQDVIKFINKEIAAKKNPITLAATSYQRLVSIHPFSDGNGRTCRLVMDYIMLRANLPPAALGKEVCVAIFGNESEVFKNQTPEKTPTSAVEMITKGVNTSYEVLEAPQKALEALPTSLSSSSSSSSGSV